MTMTTTTSETTTRDGDQEARPLHELLLRRRSPRAYDTRPIEPAALRSLFDAARWAASSNNGQPWRFIVGEQGTDDAAFDRLLGTLGEKNARWAQHVPVLILAVAKLHTYAGREQHALYDLGLAIGNMTTQATALGLALHQMGGFDLTRAREEFDIPAGYEPVAMIAVGYPGDPALLPDDLRERELAPRTRADLDTFVYGSRWAEASPLVK
jgi:nitroreductase